MLAGQSPLAVDPPVAEPDVALLIETTGEPQGEEAAQRFIRIDRAGDPGEDLGWAAPVVLTLAMCPVDLAVVVGHPAIVRLPQLGPGGGLGEVPGDHPPLDVEGGLDIGLPGPAPADLVLPDTERTVDTLGLPGQEDPPAVADERLGCPVVAHGGEEHREKSGQVLGPREAAGQDGA